MGNIRLDQPLCVHSFCRYSLAGLIPHGIAIIIFTILVRLVMSPVTYKSYLSQAKMKVLRPKITEINEKFAKDPMKKQEVNDEVVW